MRTALTTTLTTTVVIALLLLMSTAASAQSDTMSPEEIAAATYETINAGDIEAYMSLFADDAVVTVGPWQTLTGKDEIRASAQETFDAELTFEYEILEVDDGTVTAWSSHKPPDYEFPLEATEEFIVEDGKIVFNSWMPTDETMALLMGPQFGNDVLQGVYGIVLEGVFLGTVDDPTETAFNMAGSFMADGEGHITQGARTLNFAGDIQTDTFDGVYTVAEDGTATITLTAYQDGEQAAVEELFCFVAIDGSQYQCIMTGLTVPTESADAIDIALLGSAQGLRIME